MSDNVHVIQNALLAHKIAQLRDVNTPCGEFRRLVREISLIEIVDAMRDFPTVEKQVTTPLEVTTQRVIDQSNICLVPIMRAGLGMSEGLSEILPLACVGHLGIYRDHVTHEAHEYYASFPKNVANMEVILLDPMLATGGSAIDAIRQIKARGVKSIRFVCIIAAPEGVAAVRKEFPEIPVYIGALDRELNENCYILPGLGDAGDRIFGTID